MSINGERYFLKLAAAFVRGRCVQGHPMDLPDALRNELLEDLSEPALLEIFQIGQAAGLEMHKFKEHIPAVPKALAAAVRVARRFVVLSVPSQPDDNPGHIHLLDQDTLRRLFSGLGITRVTFDYVPGHLVAVANVGA